MPRAALLLAFALLAACAATQRERFTSGEQAVATIPGLPEARAWGDAGPAGIAALGMAPVEVAARRPGALDYLAISSGGPAGAYGAGVLVGWGEAGTRPEFDVVTGVSAGALIAPFAFVGAEGDAALRELWTGGGAEPIGENLNLIGLLTGQGVVDPAPLRRMIETSVDDRMVAAIARGHAEGRRLLVMTTNLDAQRPVIWNIGAIAASGRPGAADLVRAILFASASIPVAFPPTLIPARSGDRVIEELHVDGGVSSQIFAFPDAVLAGEESFAVPAGREANLWLLVNYVTGPEFGVTPTTSFGSGARAYGTLIKSALEAELFAIAGAAEEAGFDHRTAAIQGPTNWDYRSPFSTAFMTRLFGMGRQAALSGTAFDPGTGS